MSTLPIRAILFDFGMVLSAAPRQAEWQKMRELLHIEEPIFHTLYWKHRDEYDKGTLSGTEYWRTIAQEAHAPIDSATVRLLKQADTMHWTAPNEDMVDWALRLQRAGYRIGILSNIGDAMEEGVRRECDWVESFDHHVWSHRLKMRKPEPEIYAVAAEGLEANMEEILFIDDREENIRAAQQLGMRGMVYSTHPVFLQELQQAGLEELLKV